MNNIFKIFAVCVIPFMLFACDSAARIEGGLSFKTVSLQKTEKISSASLEWTGTAEIMQAAKGSDDAEEAVRLNRMIAGMISEGETDVKNALEKRKNDYVQAFKSSASEPDNGNPKLRWKSSVQGKAVSVTGQFISYEIADLSFDGSQNSAAVYSYSVFDRQTGEEAPLSFFVSEENLPELEKTLRSTFVQDKESSSYDALKADFLIEDLEVTQNFYADDWGLHFVYNPGEIAASSEGAINILVRWDALLPFLNEGII